MGVDKFRFYLKLLNIIICLFIFNSCTSKQLKIENPEQLKIEDDFAKEVKIETTSDTVTDSNSEKQDAKIGSIESKTNSTSDSKTKSHSQVRDSKSDVNKNVSKNENNKESKSTKKSDAELLKEKNTKSKTKSQDAKTVAPPSRRQPEIESELGFNGRRPIIDPFRVGEKVVHNIEYLGMDAGELTLEVLPFAQVNGKKSYNFVARLKSSDLFSKFYSVNDWGETFVDYDSLVPSMFAVHVKESGQLREAKGLNDHVNLKATFKEKKYTEKNGHEERNLEWEIPPYSQNVFSTMFYLRVFQWDNGAENVFRVADTGDNINFRGRVVKRETVKLPIGTFKTVVIKPAIETKGIFKTSGDVYIWMTDDDRKMIVKMSLKIKIGSLETEAKSIVWGQ